MRQLSSKLEAAWEDAGITSCDRIEREQTLERGTIADYAVREFVLHMMDEICCENSIADALFRTKRANYFFDVRGRVLTDMLPPAMERNIGLVRMAVGETLGSASSKAARLVRNEKRLGLRFYDFDIDDDNWARIRRIEPAPNRHPRLCKALAMLNGAHLHDGHRNSDPDLVMWDEEEIDGRLLARPIFMQQGELTGRRLVAMPENECAASPSLYEMATNIKCRLLGPC